MTRIYVAGPMTGLPDWNYPAFHAAAKQLRALGHEVLNPAENPAPACGSWAAYMRLALAQLVQCDCIVLLPGWTESKGALIERKLAHVLGMEVLLLSSFADFGGDVRGGALPYGAASSRHPLSLAGARAP